MYFGLDLCDLDLQVYREQLNLPYFRCTLPLSLTKYMINMYITEYAFFFAYFDLDQHDLDFDPRSSDIDLFIYGT